MKSNEFPVYLRDLSRDELDLIISLRTSNKIKQEMIYKFAQKTAKQNPKQPVKDKTE